MLYIEKKEIHNNLKRNYNNREQKIIQKIFIFNSPRRSDIDFSVKTPNNPKTKRKIQKSDCLIAIKCIFIEFISKNFILVLFKIFTFQIKIILFFYFYGRIIQFFLFFIDSNLTFSLRFKVKFFAGNSSHRRQFRK